MLCLMTPAAPLATKIPKGVFVTPSGRSQARRRRCGVGLPILGDNFLSKNEGVRVNPQACTKPALGHLRWAVWTAAPHPGTACWPTLPERDTFQHSQNSTRRSITRPCQNRGPVKDERKTVRIRPSVGGHRRRRKQLAHPPLGAGRLRAGLQGRRQRGLRPRLVSPGLYAF